jgi:purine-cytosine permease-like protein
MNRLGSLRGRGWQGAWRARIAGTIIVGVCMTSFGMAQPLTTVRVSVSSSGEQGNLKSSVPSISADGRYVAFISHATNLVSGDTN